MSVEDPDLPAGTRIGGRYLVDRCVRRGPFVAVYAVRAENSPSARYVARVIRLPGPGTDAAGVVNRELSRVAMLRQRAVPALVAVVREAAGLVVITERPDGSTLRDIIQKAGKLKSGEIGRLVTEVAAVLDAMHGASPPLVHRALTPDTISVADRMLRVWVEECGLTQALSTARVVPEGAPVVASQYRSPGELLGRAAPSSDVFVLASIAYECLTGRPAHDGATDVDTDALVLRGPRPSVRAFRAAGASEIDAVLQRAWSDDAGYPTAGAFARELVRVLTANPSTRGMPAVLPRTKPEAVDVGAKDDPRKQTLLGVAPNTGAKGDADERGAMKSTLLGIGSPRVPQRPGGAPSLPRPGAPFGPPVAPMGTAPLSAEGADSNADRPRARRMAETTQRVEVPRIRPPGTEPADPAAARVRPPAEMRSRTATVLGSVPLPSPHTAGALTATLPAGTVPLASPESTMPGPANPTLPIGPPTPPPIAMPTVPAAAISPAELNATLPHGTQPPTSSEVQPPVREPIAPLDLSTDAGEQRIALKPAVPESERLSDEPWGNLEPSLGVGLEDLNDAPTAPPPRDWTPYQMLGSSDNPPPDKVTAPAPPDTSTLARPTPRPADPPPAPEPSEGFGVVTADTFDIVSDDDFAPVTPARSDPPPLPNAGSPPSVPVLPVVPQPVTPLGALVSSIPPPLPAAPPVDFDVDDMPSLDTPAPPEPIEMPVAVEPLTVDQPDPSFQPPQQPSTPPQPQPAPTPSSLRPVVPAWAPTVPPPPEPSLGSKRGVRVAMTVGIALFVAGGVLTAGWLYGRNIDRRETDSRVAIIRRPQPTTAADASTAAANSASDVAIVAQATDAPSASADVAQAAASPDASTTVASATQDASAAPTPATEDAGTTVATTEDAGTTVATTEDAGTTVAATEADAGGGESRRHRHPHSDEMDEFEERLTPAIQACITDGHHRRHVHVAVTYEGSSGRATEIHVSSAYAEPPVGTCIENVIRTHPVEPFTADEYEYHFSFDSH